MKQIFGCDDRSGRFRVVLLVQLAVMASAWLLLTSCSFIQSREVTISPASASEQESYYQDEAFSREGLSFESENFLRGNMEQDDLKENPEVTLHKLNVYYDISEDPKFLRIAADYCRWLAMESGDQEFAVRAHLSALYYVRAAAAARTQMRGSAAGYDFSDFRMMQIYNDSCRGIFSFLKAHKLLANNSFSLLDLEDRRYFFDAPRYHLSVPDDTVEDFTLCSDYSVKALMQKNRQPGVGIPLVGQVAQQETYRMLKSPRGLTIPVTLIVSLNESDSHVMEVTLHYLDTSLEESAPEELGFLAAGNWPLALDFSTPLACFLNSLPDRNLISVMLESDDQEDHSGLFLIEPYQPNKIPVVFIHGLMSSPDTWVQMINALKNDPVIRKRYQFWFYSFSSGVPVMATAGDLRRVLLAAREELGTTPEARENFDKMVLIGHSMGGLVSRTLLQGDPHFIVEQVTHRTWDEITAELTAEELAVVEEYAVIPALPFVNRVVFMAVPHRGSEMAQWSLTRYGSKLVNLPKALREKMPIFGRVFQKLNKNTDEIEKLRRARKETGNDHSITGLHDLDPDSLFIRALAESPMKEGLVFHSIIGDNEQADHPGGTDGVVPYSSSHLDNAASEVIVHSGHSIHRSPGAMQELLRILLLHLRAEQDAQ
jgi:pimeloyl-ACP methyl ester carboxylesterase